MLVRRCRLRCSSPSFVAVAAVTLPGVRRRRLAKELAAATDAPSSRSQMSALGAQGGRARRARARPPRPRPGAWPSRSSGPASTCGRREFVVARRSLPPLGAAFVGLLLGGLLVLALVCVRSRSPRSRGGVDEGVEAPQGVRGAAARHARRFIAGAPAGRAQPAAGDRRARAGGGVADAAKSSSGRCSRRSWATRCPTRSRALARPDPQRGLRLGRPGDRDPARRRW